jgi:hypothetical protein
MDEFIDIIGYEGLYKINKNGDVYGIKNKKIRKPYLNKGYYTIQLWKNNKEKNYSIHRLIALHFISNDDINKNNVDHIDGIPTNNNIENLRWVTPSDNMRNIVSKQNYIEEVGYFRKDRNGAYSFTYRGRYPIYIDGKRIIKRKKSIHRNVVEEWVEQMKKEYPNEYTAGRI